MEPLFRNQDTSLDTHVTLIWSQVRTKAKASLILYFVTEETQDNPLSISIRCVLNQPVEGHIIYTYVLYLTPDAMQRTKLYYFLLISDYSLSQNTIKSSEIIQNLLFNLAAERGEDEP